MGVSVKLVSKLNYFWCLCIGELFEQNDLFWLMYVLEIVKDMYWNYCLLSDWEWFGWNVVVFSVGVNGIYFLWVKFDVGFNDSG